MKKLIISRVIIIFIFVLAFSFNMAKAQETTTTEIKNTDSITKYEAENLILREINQFRNDYLNKLNWVVTIIGFVFAGVVVLIGYSSWKLKSDAEKQLKEIEDYKIKAQEIYNAINAKYEKVVVEFGENIKEYIKIKKEAKKYLQKQIEALDDTQTLYNELFQKVKKTRTKKESKKEVEELKNEVDKLRNKIVHQIPETFSPDVSASKLGGNFISAQRLKDIEDQPTTLSDL